MNMKESFTNLRLTIKMVRKWCVLFFPDYTVLRVLQVFAFTDEQTEFRLYHTIIYSGVSVFVLHLLVFVLFFLAESPKQKKRKNKEAKPKKFKKYLKAVLGNILHTALASSIPVYLGSIKVHIGLILWMSSCFALSFLLLRFSFLQNEYFGLCDASMAIVLSFLINSEKKDRFFSLALVSVIPAASQHILMPLLKFVIEKPPEEPLLPM